MLMRKSISDFISITSLHVPHHAFETHPRPNLLTNLAFKNHKNCEQSGQHLNKSTRLVAKNGKIRRNLVVHSSVEPAGPPTPSGPPPNPLSWILGIVVAVVIPLVGQKWVPLLKYKVEKALNQAEDVVETVEKVAEEVEKVAEDIADDLPTGGKLRKAVDFVENLAERTAKEAGLVDDFIDKVQEDEEKVESFIESLEDTEAKAQKAKESDTKKN